MLFQHFENKKEMSPGFIYYIERDEDNKVTHVFWPTTHSIQHTVSLVML